MNKLNRFYHADTYILDQASLPLFFVSKVIQFFNFIFRTDAPFMPWARVN